MQQFLDRHKWQDHVDEHLVKPNNTKILKCQYPRTQCAEGYPSIQDLKFHLQNVHCVDLRRGCKRSSPDRDANPRHLKTKRLGIAPIQDPDLESAAGIKQEYKFVDEAAKLLVSRSLTTSAASTRSPSPSLNFSSEPAESGSDTPPSSTSSCEIEKIDPRLLADIDSRSIVSSIYNKVEIVDLSGVEEGVTSSQDQKDFIKDGITSHGRSSRKRLTTSLLTVKISQQEEHSRKTIPYVWTFPTLSSTRPQDLTQSPITKVRLLNTYSSATRKLEKSFANTSKAAYSSNFGLHGRSISPLQMQMDDVFDARSAGERDPERPLSVSTQAYHDKQDHAELDDNQFLVESLLSKRARRVRRRKVIQYLVKWKGYPEEENSWENEADIHEDLIRDYEARVVSA